MTNLRDSDPEVFAAITKEEVRQREGLEMIASENFVSLAVREATGSVLTNKYAEGYPAARYYGGCWAVDIAENLAIERAKKLFGVEHVNVQPHSGSQANQSVYFACLKPGDRILGMRLDQGGHLTHGHKVNLSGILFEIHSYGVGDDGFIDYDALEAKAKEVRPKLIITGASAYPRRFNFERVGRVAKEIGALHMADIAHYAGLVATGLYPSPVPHADFVTSTTHKTLRGPRSGIAMCRAAHAKALDKALFPGLQGGPLMHVVAAKAVAFGEALRPDFKTYQQQVLANARRLGEVLVARGYKLVSGGTDCHMILVDLRDKPITGAQAEKALEAAGITVNKNAVPNDTRPPKETSGIRIGSPALTTRGMKEPEFERIGNWIADVLDTPEDAACAKKIVGDARSITEAFSLP